MITKRTPINCEKCGRFVGKRGFVDVCENELFEALCEHCYDKTYPNHPPYKSEHEKLKEDYDEFKKTLEAET